MCDYVHRECVPLHLHVRYVLGECVLQHLHVRLCSYRVRAFLLLHVRAAHTHTTLLCNFWGLSTPYLAFLRININYDFTIEFAQPVIGRTTWLALGARMK